MLHVRDATENDLPAVARIYNEVIANTTAVYRDDPVSLEERRTWWAARRADRFGCRAGAGRGGVGHQQEQGVGHGGGAGGGAEHPTSIPSRDFWWTR